jgi:hypothetical protein
LSSHLWGDIAASNGNLSGDGLRDAVTIKMTKSQKHRISPVNVSARNTKGVELEPLRPKCPIDTRPSYSQFLRNR